MAIFPGPHTLAIKRRSINFTITRLYHCKTEMIVMVVTVELKTLSER
jgi:hypothetical protein